MHGARIEKKHSAIGIEGAIRSNTPPPRKKMERPTTAKAIMVSEGLAVTIFQ